MTSYQILVLLLIAFAGFFVCFRYIESKDTATSIHNAESMTLGQKLANGDLLLLIAIIGTYVLLSRFFDAGRRTTVFVASIITVWPFIVFPNIIFQRLRFAEVARDSAAKIASLILAFAHLLLAVVAVFLIFNKRISFPDDEFITPYTSVVMLLVSTILVFYLAKVDLVSATRKRRQIAHHVEDSESFESQSKAISEAFGIKSNYLKLLKAWLLMAVPSALFGFMIPSVVSARAITASATSLFAFMIAGTVFGSLAAHVRRVDHLPQFENLTLKTKERQKFRINLLKTVHASRLFAPLYGAILGLVVVLGFVALSSSALSGIATTQVVAAQYFSVYCVSALSEIAVCSGLSFALHYSGATQRSRYISNTGTLLTIAGLGVRLISATSLTHIWFSLSLCALGSVASSSASLAFRWTLTHGVPSGGHNPLLRRLVRSLPYVFTLSTLREEEDLLIARAKAAGFEITELAQLLRSLQAEGIVQADIASRASKHYKLSAKGVQLACDDTSDVVNVPWLYRLVLGY